MKDPANHCRVLSNLRFALEVMEEQSHIGLDDKAAGQVRNALQRLILKTEGATGFPPSTQLEKLSAEEELTA
jgi:hypothetical protein